MARWTVLISANKNLRKDSFCLQRVPIFWQLEMSSLRQRLHEPRPGAQVIGCLVLEVCAGAVLVKIDNKMHVGPILRAVSSGRNGGLVQIIIIRSRKDAITESWGEWIWFVGEPAERAALYSGCNHSTHTLLQGSVRIDQDPFTTGKKGSAQQHE